MVWQVDVSARVVVVDVGESHLQPMGIGEESRLGIDIGKTEGRVPSVARIPQRQTSVHLLARRIAEATVLELDPIGVILDAVGWHLIVGIVHPRGVRVVPELAIPAHQPQR